MSSWDVSEWDGMSICIVWALLDGVMNVLRDSVYIAMHYCGCMHDAGSDNGYGGWRDEVGTVMGVLG